MTDPRADRGSTLVRTISHQIAASIRADILAGVYPPGTTLLQDTIAAQFGVSKIPVREALVYLKAAGLVENRAHCGFQVRSLSAGELQELFNLRLNIEPQAVLYGAAVAQEPDHSAAEAALQALNACGNDLARAGDLNCTFHLALIVPKAQPVTNDLLFRLYTVSQRYIRLRLEAGPCNTRTADEHVGMYQAWRAGYGRVTANLLRRHIKGTRDELMSVLPSRGASD